MNAPALLKACSSVRRMLYHLVMECRESFITFFSLIKLWSYHSHENGKTIFHSYDYGHLKIIRFCICELSFLKVIRFFVYLKYSFKHNTLYYVYRALFYKNSTLLEDSVPCIRKFSE